MMDQAHFVNKLEDVDIIIIIKNTADTANESLKILSNI